MINTDGMAERLQKVSLFLLEEFESARVDATATVTVKFTMSGTVEDYAEGSANRLGVIAVLAAAAGVPTSSVTITVAAGSVVITATIQVADAAAVATTTTALQDGVLASTATFQAALTAAGVSADLTVESTPVIGTDATGGSSVPVIIGVIVGVIVVVVGAGAGFYFMKKKGPIMKKKGSDADKGAASAASAAV